MAHLRECYFCSPGENIDWCARRANSDRDADRILPLYRFSYRGTIYNVAANQAQISSGETGTQWIQYQSGNMMSVCQGLLRQVPPDTSSRADD